MKVLIVDDEVIIREGMRKVVAWSEHGFQLLETASSAEEAMERINKERPDIILTDIRMKGKSGLDLAEYVYDLDLAIEVIVLTGYDEFAYAQEALRQGVCDYLLKTSAPDDILRAVQKAKGRLEHTKEHVQWKQGERERMISSFVKRLLHKNAGPADVDRLYELVPELEEAPFQILLIDEPLQPSQLAENEMLWNTYVFGKWVPCNEKTVIIVQRDPRLEDDYLLRMAAKKITQQLHQPVFAGSVVSSLTELSSSYEQATSLILYKWLLPDHTLIGTEDIKSRIGIPHTERLPDHEAELLHYMKIGNHDDLKRWMMELIGWLFAHPQATPGSVHLYVQTLFIATIRFVNRVALSAGQEVRNYRSLPSAAEWFPLPEETLSPLFLQVLDDFQKQANRQNRYVQTAIYYIEQQIGESLTLHKVADHVHIHPNYLSDMIRKETGKSYIELLTGLRMKKAEELLLHSDAKVKDISKLVGYADWKYFTNQFKKYTGMTPSQYRHQYE
ncbi:response regulator transcription factor [Pseudalkalibacillus decolorationis]|uniref:response regulator transcription factor n=1 Tax=Pseudalkalibacillus decolorationis TaxID=163879 RepID=UPI002148E2EC|nr:response regulator [Pseudalkalibacillus decolorationis]